MNEIKFDYHRINSRRDLLHFVEEHGDKQVYEHIGENPTAWIDELNILNQILTGKPLVSGTGLNQPPIEESDFTELGNSAFLYRGGYNRLKGLWIQRNVGKDLEEITGSSIEWTHYMMGTRAKLKINQEFSEIPFEQFLPENFEQKAKPVEKDKGSNKRPLFTFPIKIGGEEIIVYAKGADVSLSYYYEHFKPGYRLTNISGISRTTSKKEMETTFDLRSLGVNVPRVIGYYEAPIEEFLFLEKVAGKQPNEMLPYHKEEIIRQDAEMLAILCLSGYRKIGFTDFDDKIFDETNLYLIDVDECGDLYHPFVSNFREILLNPKDSRKLQKFRRLQKNIFVGVMRDAIYNYKDTLTPAEQDKEKYVSAFYKRLGWKQAEGKNMKKLITFSKDYMTHGSWMSMMCETD